MPKVFQRNLNQFFSHFNLVEDALNQYLGPRATVLKGLSRGRNRTCKVFVGMQQGDL